MAHVVPLKTNLTTLASLVALTIITVYTAKYVDLGSFNLVLALFIASIKVAIVLLWFMHLKYDGWMNRVIVICAAGFLSLLIGFTAVDIFTRP
jgi:cytochrome c oxidase subunit 4